MNLAIRFEFALAYPSKVQSWIASGHEIRLFSSALASASSENYLPVLGELQNQLKVVGLPILLISGSISAKETIVDLPNSLLEEGKS